MEFNIIIGALIAIVSGLIGQLVGNYLDTKKEKRKFIFEKITDIINSISKINDGLQQDAAGVFGVGSQNGNNTQLSLELTKIKCLVKVYHPKLSNEIDKLIESINSYFSAKRDLINSQRQSANQEMINKHLETIKVRFTSSTKEIDSFSDSLSRYGNR